MINLKEEKNRALSSALQYVEQEIGVILVRSTLVYNQKKIIKITAS